MTVEVQKDCMSVGRSQGTSTNCSRPFCTKCGFGWIFTYHFDNLRKTGMNDSREDSERPQKPHLFTETMSSRNWGRRLMTPSITTVHSGSMRRFHAPHRNTRAEVAHNEDKLGDILPISSNTEHVRTVFKCKPKNNNTCPKKRTCPLILPEIASLASPQCRWNVTPAKCRRLGAVVERNRAGTHVSSFCVCGNQRCFKVVTLSSQCVSFSLL